MSVSSDDVIYALLALDAYNRHDDPILRKMGTPGNEPLNLQIGSALFKDSSDGLEVRGAATLTGSQLAGFSASYYTIGSETVISYRGTGCSSPTRRGLLAGGLAALMLPLAACKDDRAESVTRNIRVIAQAEVAGKLVEGSSVMSIRWRPGSGGAMFIDSNTEAVALDLDGRGTVYVLDGWLLRDDRLNGAYWPYYLLRAIGAKSGQGTVEELPLIRDASGRYEVSARVSRTKTLPIMVSFTDEKKRETMFEVRPEDFPKVFGHDVRFLGIWMEFTDAPATETIPQRLPVMWHLNESYKQTYSLYGEDGKLIAGKDMALPQQAGHDFFLRRGF